MSTVFKKTLVAAAVLAFAGASQAATISAGTEHSLTSQYLASTGANHTLANDFAVTLGAEYVINDTITLTFSKPLAAAVTGDLVATAVAGTDPVVGPPAVAGVVGKKGITFSVISGGAVGDTSITYRVTNIVNSTGFGAPGVTNGVVLTLPAFVMTKANLSAGATVAFSAKTNNGLDLDTSGGTARTRSLAKVVNQFTTTAPSISKTIDVNADRKKFVDGAADATGATFDVSAVFNVATLTTGGATFARPIAAAAGVKHTLTGDFSWVVDNDTTTAGLQPKANVFQQAGTCANPVWAYSATAVSLTCDAVAADTAIRINSEANKAGVAASAIPMLPAGSFTATSEVTFTGPAGTLKVQDAVAAGSWTLNGSTVTVPYLVHQYGKFSTILNVHNNGNKEGAISLDVWAEDGTVVGTNIAAGTSKPGAVVSVAKPALDALIAKGYDLSKQTKYSVRIITNVPAKDITVNSAYADVSTATVTRTPVANDSMVQTKSLN